LWSVFFCPGGLPFPALFLFVFFIGYRYWLVLLAIGRPSHTGTTDHSNWNFALHRTQNPRPRQLYICYISDRAAGSRRSCTRPVAGSLLPASLGLSGFLKMAHMASHTSILLAPCTDGLVRVISPS
jgi:hypothetical protein